MAHEFEIESALFEAPQGKRDDAWGAQDAQVARDMQDVQDVQGNQDAEDAQATLDAQGNQPAGTQAENGMQGGSISLAVSYLIEIGALWFWLLRKIKQREKQHMEQ